MPKHCSLVLVTRMKSKYQILIWVIFLTVTLDIGTKLWIHSTFELTESISILPNFFNFTYVRNFGAAFGFLSNTHEGFRTIFFAVMPVVACLTILTLIRNVQNNDFVQILALSLIMGGALGNYINRMYHGYVIDFLDFHWFYRWNWPAFNIADCAIVIGVGVLLLQILKNKRHASHIT